MKGDGRKSSAATISHPAFSYAGFVTKVRERVVIPLAHLFFRAAALAYTIQVLGQVLSLIFWDAIESVISTDLDILAFLL